MTARRRALTVLEGKGDWISGFDLEIEKGM